MKYAKKMKLVDIDDAAQHCAQQPKLQTDADFLAPRIFSTLDNFMNAILKRRDINDGEKWLLYNQALQKYLNHMKSVRSKISSSTQRQSNISPDEQSHADLTPSPFNKNISDADITGIYPLRDSIDNITNAGVRSFFEHIRESEANNVESPQLSPQPNFQQQLQRSLSQSELSPNSLNHFIEPQRISPALPGGLFNEDVSMRSVEISPQQNKRPASLKAAPSRAAKRTALQPGVKGSRLRAQLFRTRTQPPDKYEFYWRTSNAK